VARNAQKAVGCSRNSRASCMQLTPPASQTKRPASPCSENKHCTQSKIAWGCCMQHRMCWCRLASHALARWVCLICIHTDETCGCRQCAQMLAISTNRNPGESQFIGAAAPTALHCCGTPLRSSTPCQTDLSRLRRAAQLLCITPRALPDQRSSPRPPHAAAQLLCCGVSHQGLQPSACPPCPCRAVAACCRLQGASWPGCAP
jgi:hypothetical protein